MCGIWGLVGKNQYARKDMERVIKDLFLLSESRGKEASGIASLCNGKIKCCKSAVSASKIVNTEKYKNILYQSLSSDKNKIAMIGHSRLVTNGSEKHQENNQPVSSQNVTAVHNGIIVNADELWSIHKDLKKESELDTEVFVKLCERCLKEGQTPQNSVFKAYQSILGTASVLLLFPKTNTIIAATNNGSVYYWRSIDKDLILFASEEHILKELYFRNSFVKKYFHLKCIQHLEAYKGLLVDLDKLKLSRFLLEKPTANKGQKKRINCRKSIVKYLDLDIDVEPIKKIRRCSKCVLPETMPFIRFDKDGVCNYCRTYKKLEYFGTDKLNRWADKTKIMNHGKEYNSIVSFSGGRDSSYGLHYFVKELGLRPVAYSYDWGMVTDLARRNQSRMCAALGVELITVSADIRKKRNNIRKNILAWMKEPNLGLVPLFMAGDKAYFYYANLMKKRFDLDCILLASNPFEATYFKSGFCGVKPTILHEKDIDLEIEQLSMADTARMAGFYVKEFLKNPYYFNSSIVDTAMAAGSYYFIPHNYFRLYNYIPWDENIIDNVLFQEYDWEKAQDTDSTWRIGDGTAPFYNYIYYLVCGFTENDTLRSNQIREGKLKREKALELVYADNQPRWESMEWYFDTIGLDMAIVLGRVRQIKRHYKY